MEPATRFGPYEIIRRLGKSMNDVYLANDTRANRQAALKLIKTGPDALSRLVTESERRGAAIQQRLQVLDPRVIEVYDYGDLDGYFFVAMQYVEGRNLAEVLTRDGRMSALRAARVALEICGQLQKFHSFQPDGAPAAVVHGDIKPSNIHLGPNDTVRLLDFGIAKTLRPNRDFTFHNFGSPSYCSPERLGRSVLDQQADLWAVGATLYEMVAGSPPYQAEDTQKLEKLIQSRRPPRALPSSCPGALKAIIRKALAPDVGRRYPSAAAFVIDLNAFLEGLETVAEKETRGAWKPHATRESGRRPKHPAPPWMHAAGRIGTALACVLAGMLLFIGTSLCSRFWTGSRQLRANLDWELYQDLDWQFGFLGQYSPVERLRVPLRAGYERTAAQAIGRADWHTAETALGHAVDLGDRDTHTLAKLALARGYNVLAKNLPAARGRFAEAARQDPAWPDPHLAMAKTYADLPDRALAEIREAQRLGYTPQTRDTEPVAHTFLERGFARLEAGDVAGARQDFETASGLSPGIAVPDLRPPQPPAKPRVRRWQ